MADKQFKLPPISPLIGATWNVFRKTLEGQTIAREYMPKKRITAAIIGIISPFRWYEKLFVLPKARKASPKQMVFIVGHWRGGTTYLHNLMCEAENATFVTTYQTVFPNFIGSKGFFRPFIKAVMPDKRPSDNVKLNVDFPQEEEFAFSGTNPHTYYRFMYFPEEYSRHYEESTSFEGLNDAEIEQFKNDYRDLVHLAQYSQPNDLMIIKNPINTARIEMLHELYPDAKWIHIHRNPYTVYRSNLKFFRELLPTLWFHKVSDEFISDLILDIYQRLYADYDRALAKLPDLNLIEISFEEFEKTPVEHMERIYRELGLEGFDESRPKFEAYVASKKAYKKNVYKFPEELVRLVDEHWSEYVERWGYAVPG